MSTMVSGEDKALLVCTAEVDACDARYRKTPLFILPYPSQSDATNPNLIGIHGNDLPDIANIWIS